MSDLNLLDLIVTWKDLCVEQERASTMAKADLLQKRCDEAYDRIRFNLDQMPKPRPLDARRAAVYSALNSERDYQDRMTASADRPDMIAEVHVGDGLSIMQLCLDKARDAWYHGSAPHTEEMGYLRKVAGTIIKLGETYGMPERTTPSYNGGH